MLAQSPTLDAPQRRRGRDARRRPRATSGALAGGGGWSDRSWSERDQRAAAELRGALRATPSTGRGGWR